MELILDGGLNGGAVAGPTASGIVGIAVREVAGLQVSAAGGCRCCWRGNGC